MAMQPNITPEHLIIIEPITGPPEYTATLVPLVEAMNRTIKNRRDIWPSREEAGKDLRRKGVWKYYDQRVFDIYLVRSSANGCQLTLVCRNTDSATYPPVRTG